MSFNSLSGNYTVKISFWMRAEDRSKLKDIPVPMMAQWMDKAIEDEDYEYAAMLRDEIKRRKNDK